jgi:hypothetical protein
MSKLKNQKTTTKAAIFAGAAALMSLAPQSHAQSSVDALLNKLEQKGILSVDEAKELKAENATNSAADFNKAMGAKFPTPDWVTGFKINGDFRGRYEQFSTTDNNTYSDRTRYRYRLRFGIVANIKDNMEVGFRLASGDAAQGTSGQGNPVSENTTLQNNGTSKNVYIDQAYAKWTAINSGDWLLAGTIGKMSNPFNFTPMVFDPDYNPEGAAITGGYTINDKHALAFTGAAFVLDEESGTTLDPFLFGGQVALNSKWNDNLASSIGVGAFSLLNANQLTTANVPYQNQGNSRVNLLDSKSNTYGSLKYNYNPVIADASVTYTFDSAPLYPGKFPVKLAGEYINNPGAGQNNQGYWAGVTFGKSGKKHTWDLSYRYEYLQADAWYDQLVDDDMGAYYQNAAPTTTNPGGYVSSGVYGGTNVKGHLIKADYSITDYLMFSLTTYITDIIDNQAYNHVSEPNSSTVHFMADLMWKF